jgi:catechol 2,3-dioxygenase-like lactoylglutathione lyase family enzyme
MTDLQSPVPEPVPGAESPGISQAIYGMPSFATLIAADIDATVSWYTDGLGFATLFSMPGPGDTPLVVHLRRRQFQDLLLRPARGPLTPGNGCTLSFAAVYDELDELAGRARGHGGGRVDGPADTRWNTRDLTITDPDGQVVIFTAARPAPLADAGFNDQMRRWGREQGLDTGSPSPG